MILMAMNVVGLGNDGAGLFCAMRGYITQMFDTAGKVRQQDDEFVTTDACDDLAL